jgi:hypothetical protein
MTVQDLIDKALRLIGVIASGETPSTSERSDALIALNNIVTSWNAQQIALYSVTMQTIPLTGAASYALATRPQRIKAAVVSTAGGDTQAPALVDATGWSNIRDKTRTGLFAEALYCDYAYPTATIALSPKPAGGQLEIYSFTRLTQFGGLAETITLPDGYERALTSSLAIELAPEYGRPVDQALLAIAQEAKNSITTLNGIVLGETTPGVAAAVPPPPPVAVRA